VHVGRPADDEEEVGPGDEIQGSHGYRDDDYLVRLAQARRPAAARRGGV
jgi:hypothetical protein